MAADRTHHPRCASGAHPGTGRTKRFAVGILLLALPVLGQQTIFDVPSADVSPRGGWFYQHQTVARAWSGERRWVQTNAVGVGLGHEFEVDATWFNVERGALRESAPSAGFKWSPRLTPAGAAVPLRFVAGEMVQFRADSPRFGSWTYAMVSAELPRSRTQITGGVTSGSRVLFGERTTGVLAGVEEHLSDRWMLQADWFSGGHDLAYLIPGVVYRTSPHWMVSLGYQIPNRRSGGFGAIVFELTRVPRE